VKFKSSIYTQASGSVGGLTYAHNQGGMYARARSIPVNTNTAQQQVLRNAMGTLASAWNTTLTGAQRTGWETFAANVPVVDSLGDSRTISGKAWYIKANSIRIQAGVARVDAPPTLFEMAVLSLPVFTITAAGTTASMAFTNTDGWAGEVGGYLLVYASRAQNATRNFWNGPYRFAGKVSGAGTPPTTPATITLPFASGPTASKQFFRVVASRADGRPSATFRIAGTV
jgi:hypothetical protein